MFDFKGKSLIEFPDNYTVVDLETTGLEFQYDDIIEISAVKVRSGEITDKFSTLVQPPIRTMYFYNPEGEAEKRDCYISDFISDLTGITNEMLETAPSIKEVLPSFKDFVGNDILVGHNIVSFDGNFLCCAFQKHMNAEFCNDYVDTRRISRWILKDLEHHRLSDIAAFFGIEYEGAHRAEKDCLITNDCFAMLKSETAEQYGSIDAFIDFVREKKRRGYRSVHAKDIETALDEIDIENPFYGKYCVFTGKFDKITRKEAMQIIKNLGGENEDTITKKTNFLIIGNVDFSKSIKDGKSSKMKKAEKYKEAGQEIDVISEDTFYMMSEIENNPKLAKNKDEVERDKDLFPSPLIYKTFAFTGEFETSRKRLEKMLSDVGAVLAKSVEKSTNYLVKGDISDFPDWALERKLYKAEEAIKNGNAIQIISEQEFLELIKNAKSTLS